MKHMYTVNLNSYQNCLVLFFLFFFSGKLKLSADKGGWKGVEDEQVCKRMEKDG